MENPRETSPTGGPTGADGDVARIPLGQRFYDSPFVLLVLGIVIMAICYTGWGLWELAVLPTSTLP